MEKDKFLQSDLELQLSDSYRDKAPKLRSKIILYLFSKEETTPDYESIRLTRSRFSTKTLNKVPSTQSWWSTRMEPLQ